MELKSERSGPQWYALHTKPNKEKSVAMLLGEHHIETFVPMTVSYTSDKQKRSVPFFRGYIFASLDLNRGKSSPWRWTPGLRYIVSYGDVPIPIPNELINVLEEASRERYSRELTYKHPFKTGDVVRIKNGPFKDMLAVFQGPTTPSERVQVLLTALRQSVRVRTEAANLEKYSGSTGQTNTRKPRRTRGRGRVIH